MFLSGDNACRSSIAILCVHALQIVITLATYALVASSVGFKRAQLLHEEHEKLFATLQLLETLKALLPFPVFGVYALICVANGFAVKRGKSLIGQAIRRPYRRSPSHWTAAGSRGMFAEAAKAVIQAHDTVTLLTLLAIISQSLPRAIQIGANVGSADADPEKVEQNESICGTGTSICLLGAKSLRLMSLICGGILGIQGHHIILTPTRFNSPVAMKAAEVMGNTRLQRFQKHHRWVGLVSFFGMLQLTVVKKLHRPSLAFYQYFFLSSYPLMAFQIASLLYFAGVKSPLAWWRGRSKVADDEESPLMQSYSSPAISQAARNNRATKSKHTYIRRLGTWLGAGLAALAGYKSSAGVRFHQNLFLAISVYSWCNYDLTLEHNVAHLAGVWALRLAIISLFLLQRDNQMTFDDLSIKGVACGLVADARQLQKVLRRYIDSGGLCVSESSIKMYQASIFRMREALAVSYRWQPESKEVAPGLQLNMSLWQMDALASALENSTALYGCKSWTYDIDLAGCSVAGQTVSAPAEPLQDQKHSADTHDDSLCGFKYHQRGWTLQEYCVSPHLVQRHERLDIIDPANQDDFGSRGHNTELAQYETEREAYLGNCQTIWPCWLSKALAANSDDRHKAFIKKSYQRYKELSTALNVAQPSDLTRALYPLLMNAPVENDTELLALVQQVAEIVDEDGQDLLDELLNDQKSFMDT
eukprot:scaffold24331_cov20-Prasinocladus_malaysianus.AAC.1